MTTVALDTSVLMAPIERDLRLFDELDRLLGAYEVVVPAAVRAELDELAASGSGEAARAASVGRDLAERGEAVETAAAGGDDALVELARSGATDLVATLDRGLRRRVLDAGVPVATARGRTTLQIIQP